MGTKPAIIIHRTRPCVSELTDGLFKLDEGQWGFATESQTLVVRDLEENYYYFRTEREMLKLILIKEPVQTLEDLFKLCPPKEPDEPLEDDAEKEETYYDRTGTIRMVLDENSYYFKTEDSWERFGKDYELRNEFKFRNNVVTLADDYDIPVYDGKETKETFIGKTYNIVSDTTFPIRVNYQAVGDVSKAVRIASGTYASLILMGYNEDNVPLFALSAAAPAADVSMCRLDVVFVSSNPAFQSMLESETDFVMTSAYETLFIERETKRIEIPQGTYSVSAACDSDGFEEYLDEEFDAYDMAVLRIEMVWRGVKLVSDYEDVRYEIEIVEKDEEAETETVTIEKIDSGDRIPLKPGIYRIRAIGSDDYLPDVDRGSWNNEAWQDTEIFEDSNEITLNPMISQPIATFEVIDDVTGEKPEFKLYFKSGDEWVLQESHDALLSEDESEFEYKVECLEYAPQEADITDSHKGIVPSMLVAFEGKLEYSNDPQTISLDARSIFRVRTAAELQFMGVWAVGESCAGRQFYLDNDIDLEAWLAGREEGFAPIGSEELPFMGNFDGMGHKIENLMIYSPDMDNAGLFGVIDGAVLENLTVMDNSD